MEERFFQAVGYKIYKIYKIYKNYKTYKIYKIYKNYRILSSLFTPHSSLLTKKGGALLPGGVRSAPGMSGVGMSEGFLYGYFLEAFDEVALTDVVVALYGETALVAGGDLLDIVFEALERT